MYFYKKLALFFLFIFFQAIALAYEPTHQSVSQHPLPEWFQDAKFGIMIHYGLYSVPGWAPLNDPTGKIMTNDFFYNNPYAEWYLNSMQIVGSPTYLHHLKTFGPNFKYDQFQPLFNAALHQWNPDEWAQLFSRAGAKYVVLVTKHCDGFLLWPSKYRNPLKPNFVAERNVVGELTNSVRRENMRMGFYYSGGYDWSWKNDFPGPITDFISSIKKVPQSQDYVDYVDHQWHELIQTYHPDLLWNDVALPAKVDKYKLFADYYNTVPEGVLNDRWNQGNCFPFSLTGQPPDILIDYQLKTDWFDYYSPEYATHYFLRNHKWEADHGPGYSFGYNQEEFLHPEHFKTLDALIDDLIDLVSKNGNLLLAIGPEPDGTIPDLEKNLLLGMGEWLQKNDEGIYATRPWIKAEGIATPGIIPVRYTVSKDKKYLYIFLLKNPQGNNITIHDLNISFMKIVILNGKEPITTSGYIQNNNLVVDLSSTKIPREHPLGIKLEL